MSSHCWAEAAGPEGSGGHPPGPRGRPSPVQTTRRPAGPGDAGRRTPPHGPRRINGHSTDWAVTVPLLPLALSGVDIILFQGACGLQALSKLQVQRRPVKPINRASTSRWGPDTHVDVGEESTGVSCGRRPVTTVSEGTLEEVNLDLRRGHSTGFSAAGQGEFQVRRWGQRGCCGGHRAGKPTQPPGPSSLQSPSNHGFLCPLTPSV